MCGTALQPLRVVVGLLDLTMADGQKLRLMKLLQHCCRWTCRCKRPLWSEQISELNVGSASDAAVRFWP